MTEQYKVWYANDDCGPVGSSVTLWVLAPGEESPWLWSYGWDALGDGREWNLKRRPSEEEVEVWRHNGDSTLKTSPTNLSAFLAAKVAESPCLGYPIKQVMP